MNVQANHTKNVNNMNIYITHKLVYNSHPKTAGIRKTATVAADCIALNY